MGEACPRIGPHLIRSVNYQELSKDNRWTVPVQAVQRLPRLGYDRILPDLFLCQSTLNISSNQKSYCILRCASRRVLR